VEGSGEGAIGMQEVQAQSQNIWSVKNLGKISSKLCKEVSTFFNNINEIIPLLLSV